MAHLIFNEDPNHYIYTRTVAGVNRVTKEDLQNFILQYKDTQITDFMICLNASMTFYPSKRSQSAIDKYRAWVREGKTDHNDKNLVVRCMELYVHMEDDGLSPQQIWIDTLRQIGIHPWISIRMNDIHETNQEDSFLFSEFYKTHRAMNRASHRKPANYYENGLDYLYEEVRTYYLTTIEEGLDTFDTDGIELDFMREIYSIGIGREYEGIAVINAFMTQVYELVKKAEKKWGHSIRIGVRLPDSPEKCLRLGFDFFDWVERGIIDLITVTPRWSSSDSNLLIDLWKRILAGKNVELAAGLEILLDAYNRRGRKYLSNTYETAIALACAYLSQGANAIYLFNYMDTAVPSDDPALSIFADPTIYHRFLTTVADEKKVMAEVRRHVLTYDDVYAVGAPGLKQLPLTVVGNRGEVTSFEAVRLPTGKIPVGREVKVVLGFAKDNSYQKEDVLIYLNAKICTLVGQAEPVAQQYTDMDYLVFRAENDGHLPPVSVIEVGITEGRATVHWVEVDIQ